MNATLSNMERINFIEREPFVLSYGRMAQIAAAVIGIGLATFVVEKVRVIHAISQSVRLQQEVSALKADRDRLLKIMAVNSNAGGGVGEAALRQVFEQSLNWSGLLKDLGQVTPHTLWLTSLAPKGPKSIDGELVIIVNGEATEVGAIPLYLKALAESSRFTHVVLTSSHQAEGSFGRRYQFTTELTVKESQRRAKS